MPEPEPAVSNRLLSIACLLIPGSMLFAHEGDHGGLSEWAIALHHAAPVLASIGTSIGLAALVITKCRKTKAIRVRARGRTRH